jgi:hypothetical protein
MRQAIQLIYNEIDIERLFSKIIKGNNENDCWDWLGHVNADGYPHFQLGYQPIRAHRLVFEWYYKLCIINDSVILHKCDNCRCCNPLHLQLGNQKENIQDKVNKNRQARGEAIGSSVLTDNDVTQILIDICNKKYKSQTEISIKYNVELCAINSILNGITWTHITNKLQFPLIKIKQLIDGRAKLTEEDIIELYIRVLNNHFTSVQDLSSYYEISDSHAKSILKGKTWKKVYQNFINKNKISPSDLTKIIKS